MQIKILRKCESLDEGDTPNGILKVTTIDRTEYPILTVHFQDSFRVTLYAEDYVEIQTEVEFDGR